MMVEAATTYVQISREEIHEWLNDPDPKIWKNGGWRGKWELSDGTAGIYLLKLSPTVAIKFSSTVTKTGVVVQRAQASMQLSMVSIPHDFVVNKVAQDRGHFARTLKWRKNWAEGIDVFVEAYTKASKFYDRIAEIEDRAVYAAKWKKTIEETPGWESSSLKWLHNKLQSSSFLSREQETECLETISKMAREAEEKARPPQAPPTSPSVDSRLVALRALWKAADAVGNERSKQFVQSLGEWVKSGKDLTPRQNEVIVKMMHDFRLGVHAPTFGG